MSNVRLSIGGRIFAVACADGEEAHIERLGQLIDEKVTAADAAAQPESRMLLFASLMLADEVHELRQRQPAGAPSPALERRLLDIAERMENLATLLEGEPTSS